MSMPVGDSANRWADGDCAETDFLPEDDGPEVDPTMGSQLHICSVLTSLTSGGAEMLVTGLNGAFVRSGFQSTVIALCDAATVGNSPDMEAQLRHQIEKDGGQFVSLGLNHKRRAITGGMALRGALQQLQPNIVHAHTARALGMIAIARAHVPVVLTHHNSKLSFPPRMLVLFDRIASEYVAISQEIAELYRTHARRPCTLIHNAPSPRFHADFPRTRVSRPARILSIGALSDQKNYGLLIKVAKHLREGSYAFPMPIFQIAGHGPTIHALRATAAEYGLSDHVLFLGERSDIDALMTESDIYLNTSAYEGMPIALLEAMAMALPIVATNVAGNRELIRDHEGGLLCEFGNPAAIARGLASLINDGQFYRRMSAASLTRSQSYSLSRTADLHIELYESLITKRHSSKLSTESAARYQKG